MTENKILRMSIVLQEHVATTVDKYICKLVEYILYISQERNLSAIELCERIKNEFELEFDALEIKNSIDRKARGRIQRNGNQYTISANVITQLQSLQDPFSLLREYVHQFISEQLRTYDEAQLFNDLKDYIYYCFNSGVENILGLLLQKPNCRYPDVSFTNDAIEKINDFISWDNAEKNRILYNFVSISYEYCMLTTKKDSLLSRKIFQGKCFLLDSNIIFRMAGINKDERRFVINSFIKKCNEMGIELYYSSETLNEIFRVIDSQIKYIKYLTQGQAPVDSDTLQKLNESTEINDFYSIYYRWCKDPQNRFDDYLSFHEYLRGMIRNVITDLKFVNISNGLISTNKSQFEEWCISLDSYKKSKRPQKFNSQESLKTDVNNIQYIVSKRNGSFDSNLWQTNYYIVSADQLLTSWSKQAFSGVPIVVIPSTWLSIMLRFTGRSDNDYKAYCLFMGLRQHREENVAINPETLLIELSKKTSDATIKQRIIEEILNDTSSYSFESESDYSTSIENAFELLLSKSTEEVKKVFEEKMEAEKQERNLQIYALSDQLKAKSTEEEYCIKFANKKAENKIDRWKKAEFIQVVLPAISVLLVVIVGILLLNKIEPIYSYIAGIDPVTQQPKAIPIGSLSAIISIIAAVFNFVVIAPIKYLASDNRKQNLIKKYMKESSKYLKS